MANIDELFATMEGDSRYVDVHDIIYIDPVTRQLHIPGTELVLGVEGDNRGERKYFCAPSIVGNDVALNACTLKVRYVNAAGEHGSFSVSDITDNGDSLLFSWELSEKVTRKAGDVSFDICVCRDVGGETVNEWHTTTVVAKVLPGIDTPINVDEEEDHGGAGGQVISTHEYILNTAAYGSDESMIGLQVESPHGMLDKTVDDIDTTVSAPWETFSAHAHGWTYLSDQGLGTSEVYFGGGDHVAVLRLVVPSAGIYIPVLKYTTDVHGMTVGLYLTKMTEADATLRATYSILNDFGSSEELYQRLDERIASIPVDDTLGEVDMCSAEASVIEHKFNERSLEAGDYLLFIKYVKVNSAVSDADDTLTYLFNSFKLEGVVVTPDNYRMLNLRNGDGEGSLIQYNESEANGFAQDGEWYEPKPKATGYGAAAFGRYTEAIGDSSMAVNYDAIARGIRSFACNQATLAEGTASFAANKGQSLGDRSATFGSGVAHAEMAFAIGKQSTAYGRYAVAEGEATVAGSVDAIDDESVGKAAHAEGQMTEAYGNASHAQGYKTHAIGHCAHAQGYDTYAKGAYTHAQGESTAAEGRASHSQGFGTKALGNYSHAGGYNSEASGSSSIAHGEKANASGIASTAFGKDTKAIGARSFAAGDACKAIGDYSVALGNACEVSGTRAFAAGYSNKAAGAYSAAFGHTVATNNNYQAAFGSHNNPVSTAALMVGYGSDGALLNIMEMDRNGTLTLRPRASDAASGKEASLKLNNTIITETQLKKLLALIDNA